MLCRNCKRPIPRAPKGAFTPGYGWARPAKAIKQKIEISKTIYPWGKERLDEELRRGYLEWIPLLRPFTGPPPAAARAWIAATSAGP